MKRRLLTSAVAILFLCSATLIPGKTKEKDIIGKWKLHLDISKAVDEKTKDDDDDIGAAFARGIINMVDDLVEEIDITFDFQKNNVLVVTHDSDDRQEESTERYRWKISKDGYVVTTPIHKKHFSVNDDEGWILKKGKLIPVDQDNDKEEIVWLEKVKN